MDTSVGGKHATAGKSPKREEAVLSRGIFLLCQNCNLLIAFADLVYPSTQDLSSCCGSIFTDMTHGKGLQTLSQNGKLTVPLYPPARKGVRTMSVLLDFIISIAAGMVGNYISKWLDGWMNRR